MTASSSLKAPAAVALVRVEVALAALQVGQVLAPAARRVLELVPQAVALPRVLALPAAVLVERAPQARAALAVLVEPALPAPARLAVRPVAQGPTPT